MDNYEFDILLQGALGVDYILQLDYSPRAGQVQQIENEIRQVGGEAFVCARLLASWGARVCLFGTPIGDDSNGRFVQQALQQVPEMQVYAPIVPALETSYRVVLEGGSGPPAILRRFSGDEASASVGPSELPTARLAACGKGDLPGAPAFEAKCTAQNVPLFYWVEAPKGAEASLGDFVFGLAWRGAMLWAAEIQGWDYTAASRFSYTASCLLSETPHVVPTLGQIEAKQKATNWNKIRLF